MKIIKQVWSPKKRNGRLLKGNGVSSSDVHSRDDSSSSLSKRQKNKTIRDLFFRKRSTTAAEDDEDGYDSDGSTRSTSSSFLQYQAKFFKLKNVLERRKDGSEACLQSKSKLPTIFDRIYNRQNEVRKSCDYDYASDDSDEDLCDLSEIVCEEITCSELIEPSATAGDNIVDDNDVKDDRAGSKQKSVAMPDSTSKKHIQESGEATAEGRKTPKEDKSSSAQSYPTQELTLSLPSVSDENQQKKKQKKKTDGQAPVPLSIPRTISYSLRSAISDGSKRERNSHSLMERRAFRPNGSHIDTSYWSHRGKRSYMEGLCTI